MRSQGYRNILFFLPDQQRADFLGMNPLLPMRTPHVDALAHGGTVFSRAFTPSPVCAPARACLISGRPYHRCGVPNNSFDYPLDQPTYCRALRDTGYIVAGVGKFDLHKNTLDWNLDGSRLLPEWGFTAGIDNEGKWDAITSGAQTPKGPYMAYLHARGLANTHVTDFVRRREVQNRDTFPTPLPDDAYCDNWIAENGLRLLREFPRDRPWHLVVNFTGPHDPWDVTIAMQERWRDVIFPPPHANDQWDAATHHQVRRNYAAMIENIDRHVGRFLDVIRARGEEGRTLVIYASDHGEMLGDHNRWGKTTYYEPSVGIPLIVAGPGVRANVVSDALVSLHDLTATILDYAGADPLAGMESRSLRLLLEGSRADHRAHAISALNDWQMISDGRYKLILTDDAAPILFDRATDPGEDVNSAAQAPAVVARLRVALARAMAG